MATKQAVKATKPFNRNLDDQMIVGHPTHRNFHGRYLLLSTAAASALVGMGLVEEIDRAEYDERLRNWENGDGFDLPKTKAKDRDPVTPRSDLRSRPKADEVRKARTGGQADGAVTPSVTMSVADLRGIAAARSLDMAKFDAIKGNRDRVAFINAAPVKEGTGDETDAGRVAAMTADSTNHPPGESPHTGAGLASADDAAPAGGGGPAA